MFSTSKFSENRAPIQRFTTKILEIIYELSRRRCDEIPLGI